MHEVSLIEDLIQQIVLEAGRQSFTQVRSIRIRLGVLAHAQPHALYFCFAAVTSGTIAEGAQLMIDTISGQGRCNQCLQTMPIDDRYMACKECGSAPLTILTGDEFQLIELEVE